MANHRAQQVLVAAKTQLDTDISDASVFRRRLTSFSTDLQQVPAINVACGPDNPKGERGFELIGSFDSELALFIEIYAKNSDPETLEDELLDLRKQVHQSLMGSSRLGLDFVVDIYPAAAEQPEYETDGQADTGRIVLTWIVEYRSSVNDPSA